MNPIMDFAKLPFIIFDTRQTAPECSVVYYFVSEFGECVYIGSTRNFRQRMKGPHHIIRRKQAENCRIYWQKTEESNLLSKEKEMIKLLRPAMNVKDKNTKKRKTVNMQINGEVWREFRIWCLRLGRSATSMTESLINDYNIKMRAMPPQETGINQT